MQVLGGIYKCFYIFSVFISSVASFSLGLLQCVSLFVLMFLECFCFKLSESTKYNVRSV